MHASENLVRTTFLYGARYPTLAHLSGQEDVVVEYTEFVEVNRFELPTRLTDYAEKSRSTN